MLSQGQEQNASHKDLNVTEPEEIPRDSVSCISWTPSGKNLTFATSDWNGWIRIYDVGLETSTLVQKGCLETESPCLAMNWHDDETTVFAGCIDGSVKALDVGCGQSDIIGYHEGLVKGVHWLPSCNALLTLSDDQTLRFWDPRQAGHVAGFRLPEKVYCSDLMYPWLGIGFRKAKILLLDLPDIQRQLGRETPACLDSPFGQYAQLTSMKFFSGESNFGIGMSGNDGRCNISTIEDDLATNEKELSNIITFKAHKIEQANHNILLYPANSIGFHPHRGSGFVCTIGGEGKMHFWDANKRERIVDFDFKGSPVTRAEIDPTGRFLAYSLGYDWSRGIQGYLSHPSKVCVHVLQEKELEKNYQGEQNYPLKY